MPVGKMSPEMWMGLPGEPFFKSWQELSLINAKKALQTDSISTKEVVTLEDTKLLRKCYFHGCLVKEDLQIVCGQGSVQTTGR